MTDLLLGSVNGGRVIGVRFLKRREVFPVQNVISNEDHACLIPEKADGK